MHVHTNTVNMTCAAEQTCENQESLQLFHYSSVDPLIVSTLNYVSSYATLTMCKGKSRESLAAIKIFFSAESKCFNGVYKICIKGLICNHSPSVWVRHFRR